MVFRVSQIMCLCIFLQAVFAPRPLHAQECHINGANTGIREISIESIDSHFNFIWAGSNEGLMRCPLSCPYDPPYPLDDKDRQNTYIDDQERARKGNDPNQCKCSVSVRATASMHRPFSVLKWNHGGIGKAATQAQKQNGGGSVSR